MTIQIIPERPGGIGKKSPFSRDPIFGRIGSIVFGFDGKNLVLAWSRE